MSSATYILSDTNETISWTFDRLLSNVSIEKKDLSLLGYIIGILSIVSTLSHVILRIFICFYKKVSLNKKKSFASSSPSTTSSLTTDNTTSEF